MRLSIKSIGFDPDIHFVAPGAFPDLPVDGKRLTRVTLLPHASAYYHPDLVHARLTRWWGKSATAPWPKSGMRGCALSVTSPRQDFRESAALWRLCAAKT
jgi:hypothetical protein